MHIIDHDIVDITIVEIAACFPEIISAIVVYIMDCKIPVAVNIACCS